MPFGSAGSFFSKLLPSILSDLRRIAGRSNGEVTVEDLQSEAWIVAHELGETGAAPADPTDKGLHHQILSRLYNRFVKFADKHLWFAVRLDEQREDEDGDRRENSIAARLSGPESDEPSQAIETRQSERDEEQLLRSSFSEAVAYVRLFSNMRNERALVCEHLAIAGRTLRRRVRRAERLVSLQSSLFDGVTAISEDFIPPRSPSVYLAVVRKCRGQIPRMQFRLFARAYVPIRRVE